MFARFFLCADDFAQCEEVSAGILDLVAKGRLSGVSVMTNSPAWSRHAALLLPFAGRISVGLHLTLTHGLPLGSTPNLASHGAPPVLPALICRAFLRQLDLEEIRSEIHRQCDAFERCAGMPPDHVDGHQHIHVLPGIRSVLLAVLRERYRGRAILVRDPSDRPLSILLRKPLAKPMMVAALSVGFGSSVRRSGFLVNMGFSGFSRFAKVPYDHEFAQSLRFLGREHLIMCHPGRPSNGNQDPLFHRRGEELDQLMNWPGLPEQIWHPSRRADDGQVNWAGFCHDQ